MARADDVSPWLPSPRDGAGARRWLAAHEYYRMEIVRVDPRVVFFGDSIVERLATVGAAAFAPIVARGAFAAGIAGDTTQNALWRIEHGAFDDIAPRAVVVVVGTNDLPDRSPADVARGMAAVVEGVRERLPSATVVLVGLLPRDDGAVRDADGAVITVNALLAAMTFDEKVRFRNIGRAFVDEDGRPSRRALVDGLHPSAEGYARFVTTLAPDLEAALAP